MLERARDARTPNSRMGWAKRGLATHAPLDRVLQTGLLRQLYLGLFEEERFAEAAVIAEQMLELGEMTDVSHQDAARAWFAAGDVNTAIGHLRLAARSSPPQRKAFHHWTLGSLCFLLGKHDEALAALERASRWGPGERPLYQAHRAVVKCAKGDAVTDVDQLLEQLEQVPAGRGYGRFVLGQLAFYGKRPDVARAHLDEFVRRTSGGKPLVKIALREELRVAEATLSKMLAS